MAECDDLPVYEVFQKVDALAEAMHVGSVRAAFPVEALQLARETFFRRDQAHDVWVVPARAVYRALEHPETLPGPRDGKEYRLPEGYHNGPLWKRFKAEAQRIEDVADDMASLPKRGKIDEPPEQ